MKLNHDCIYVNTLIQEQAFIIIFQNLIIEHIIFRGSSVNSGIKSRENLFSKIVLSV